MRQTKNILFVATAIALLSLSACGSIPGFGSPRETSAEDKSGRVTMVLNEEKIEANPQLATEAITLPAPASVEAWQQAGANAQKVVGHVLAGDQLKITWRANVGAGSSKKSAVTTPPVTSDTHIFTLDAEQTIYKTEIATGRTAWKHKLSGLSKRDKIGLGGGLGLDGDTLVVASGFGYVQALSASDGSELWTRSLGAPMTGAPTIKDGRIFVASNNNEIFALSLSTGDTLWSDQAIAESARVLGSPSPAAVEDFVIAPYSSGEIIAYLASNGRRLWTDAISKTGRFTPISEINDIGSRPILAGGLVFASSQSGITIAIDGRSGGRVWSKQIGSTQAPALANQYLFVIGTDATLVAMNAGTGEAYWVKQLRQFEKEEKKQNRISYAGPLLASGKVIVLSSRGELLAFSPQTGEQVGSLKLGSTVYIEPVAAQGKLLVLTDEAKLIAIE